MRELHVDIKNKIATYSTRGGAIVCGNNDYKIRFSFDSEWDEYESKTVRFIWNDKYIDVVILEDTVPVPMLSQVTELTVGVYAGEKLYTTTPAKIPCLLSVLCESDVAKEADYYEVNGTLEYRLPVIKPEDDAKILQAVDGVYELREAPDLTMNSEVVNEVLGNKVKPVEAIALQNQADIKALQAELNVLDGLPTLVLGDIPDDTTIAEMGALLNTDSQTVIGAINELNDRTIKGAYYNEKDGKWYEKMWEYLGEKIFEGEITITSLNYRPKYSLFDLSLIDIEVGEDEGVITIATNTIKELWELLPDETQTKITAWYNNTAKPWLDGVGADVQEWLSDAEGNIAKIKDKVGDTVDTVVAEAKEGLQDGIDKAQEKADEAGTWIDEKGEIIRKWFAGELEEGAEFLETANAKIEAFGKDAKDWVDGVGAEITDWLDNGEEEASKFADKVEGTVDTAVSTAKTELEIAIENLKKSLENLGDDASEFAQNVLAKLTNIFTPRTEQAEESESNFTTLVTTKYLEDLNTESKTVVGGINEANDYALGAMDSLTRILAGEENFQVGSAAVADKLRGESDLETYATTTIAAINEINSTLNDHINGRVLDLSNTDWVLNASPAMSGTSTTSDYNELLIKYYLNFVSNGTSYTTIQFWKYSGGYAYGIKYDDTSVYTIASYQMSSGGTGTWTNEAYKTVSITDGVHVLNSTLIDWFYDNGALQAKDYQTKTDDSLETDSKEIVGAINELHEEISNIDTSGSTGTSSEPCLTMPQIRFVGMPCSGYLGWVDWSQVMQEQDITYENLKFTIEIVGGGALQSGDAIQICRMGCYSSGRKLRRLFEYAVTEDDLGARFITFEVPWNDKKAIKLFTKWATSGVNDKTIYFRIRRPTGSLQSNDSGMTVDAEFSNVVPIRCFSYYYAWDPTDYGLETSTGASSEYFYHIRIT